MSEDEVLLSHKQLLQAKWNYFKKMLKRKIGNLSIRLGSGLALIIRQSSTILYISVFMSVVYPSKIHDYIIIFAVPWDCHAVWLLTVYMYLLVSQYIQLPGEVEQPNVGSIP